MAENGYDKIAGYIVFPAVCIGVALYALYGFVTTILPWLLLIVALIGGVWFYIWQRGTRRSHPWD